MANKVKQLAIVATGAAVLGVGLAPSLQGAVITKDNNSTNLDQAGSWLGGAVPTSTDIALWDVTVTSANTVTLGSNQSWQGLSFTTMGGNVTINSNTLTLGSAGISLTGNKTITINSGLVLATDQTWNITTGSLIPAGGVVMNGYQLTLTGGATKQVKGAFSGTGSILVNGGSLKMTNAGATGTGVTATVAAGANVTFDTASGAGSAARLNNLILNGGALVSGGRSANTVESIANALTIGTGGSATAGTIVTVNPNAAANSQLSIGSFARGVGAGSVLFRGNNLGVNAITSSAANSANIVFASAPTLTGTGAAGTSMVGILVGAYGDTSGTGNGSGLVTYDSTYGIRLLNNSTEYTTAITDGQTQLDNVRYSNTSGNGVITATLTSPTTTINSLSFSLVGTGTNTGVTVTGNAGTTLVLNSGVIYANHLLTTTAIASDAMIVSVPTLDLSGKEGVFTAYTIGAGGATTGVTNAPLEIRSAITNDGGNGITKNGPGVLKISGSTQSAYTGSTVVNAGYLYFAKSTANIAVPNNSTIVVNGGGLLQDNNQIPDSANVVVSGGNWTISTSNSNGNVSSETINNLTLTSGIVKNGQTRGGTLNILGTATLSGGVMTLVGDGSNVTVSGLMAISNSATLTLGGEGGSYKSALALNGGLTLTNASSGAYVPVTLSAGSSAGKAGGKLTLAGDLTFVGNGTNANTTTIAAPAGTGNSGTIALSGIRTFNVGDGAAADDLTIAAAVTDAASAGGILKTGSGTLVLSGSNTYTGATTVGNGILKLVSGGSLATSGVTVDSGAAFINNGAYSGGVTANGTLSGSGTLTGAISGAGLVSPGNSPGILTVGQVNPTGNLGFAFEFTGTGSPAYGSATASVNDVLRITDATTPFTAALASTNTIGVYLNVTALTGSDKFNGAFYTDAGSDFLSSITNGTYDYYVRGDGNGAVSFNGVNYYTLAQYNTLNSSAFSFSVSTIAESADFGGGAVNGYVTQFAVPEPAMLTLLGLGGLAFLRRRRNG